MPWGWKKDVAATALAHGLGRFVDVRSAVDTKGYDHLKGKDVEPFRRRIFQRADHRCECTNGGKERCEAWITWEDFEMHHDPDGYERYDSMESCFAFCRNCHKAQHVQVKLKSIPGV